MHVNRILRGRRSPTEEDRNAPNTPPANPSAHPGQTEVALTHRPWASVAFLPRCSQAVSNRKASMLNGDTRSRHRLQDVKKTTRHLCYMLPEPYCLWNKHTSIHSQSLLFGIGYFSFQSKLLFVWRYQGNAE